ncbi:hypothetical protein F2Q70_00003627 [Brassica cretica]|uniref:Uncharacterized protein n=1 Tax=Brassica cretica TaxID=69181 RepID=A0A8S9IMK7_BRACR|nr:hypothetical protein F2Q70_00003627 [Brassica cretica]
MYIHISTRKQWEEVFLGSSKKDPTDSRTIHKSKRAVDTPQAAIGSVDIQVSNDTVHPVSNDTVEVLCAIFEVGSPSPADIRVNHRTVVKTELPYAIKGKKANATWITTRYLGVQSVHCDLFRLYYFRDWMSVEAQAAGDEEMDVLNC